MAWIHRWPGTQRSVDFSEFMSNHASIRYTAKALSHAAALRPTTRTRLVGRRRLVTTRQTHTQGGGNHACVARRDRPQNPAHTEWAPMRGTLGRGVGDRSIFGCSCGTVSWHSAVGAPLRLYLYLFLFFQRSGGKEIREPCNDGLGQERDNVKSILLLSWPFGLHVAG